VAYALADNNWSRASEPRRSSEFLAPATRRLLIGARAFHFVRRDAAVAVLVEPQNKLTRLVDKLAAADLAILVFIKVAEVRVGEGAPSPTD
jgi:hypothetical protein